MKDANGAELDWSCDEEQELWDLLGKKPEDELSVMEKVFLGTPTNQVPSALPVGVVPISNYPSKGHIPYGDVKVLCKTTGGDATTGREASVWVLFWNRASKETHKLRIDIEKIYEHQIRIANPREIRNIYKIDDDTYLEVNNQWSAFKFKDRPRELWDKLVNMGFEHCKEPHKFARKESQNWD